MSEVSAGLHPAESCCFSRQCTRDRCADIDGSALAHSLSPKRGKTFMAMHFWTSCQWCSPSSSKHTCTHIMFRTNQVSKMRPKQNVASEANARWQTRMSSHPAGTISSDMTKTRLRCTISWLIGLPKCLQEPWSLSPRVLLSSAPIQWSWFERTGQVHSWGGWISIHARYASVHAWQQKHHVQSLW